MKVHYDLHIHSCLSPCGDADMTPNNIVHMAQLCGLDMIALTDHNSCKNCPALLKTAEKEGITAVAGMELCTAEECHVVCLFPSLDSAMAFDAFVASSLLPIQNKPSVFGEQWIMDERDQIVGRQKVLLLTASPISVDNVTKFARSYGGTAFPAHVDRPSYSVTSALGTLPPVGFRAAEVSPVGDECLLTERYAGLRGIPLLFNSDAHSLGQIQEAGPWLELPECTPKALIAALNGAIPCAWSK